MKYLEILTNSKSSGGVDWGYMPYVFILIGSFFWTIAWIYPNEHNVNFTEASIIRGFTLIVVNYLMCRNFNVPVDFKNRNMYKYLSLRSTIMIVHGFVFAFSQYMLPLPVVHTINCCGALFVFIIDYFMNGVKTNSKQNIGILIGLIGVLLATNGHLLTKFINPEYVYHTKFQNYITDDIIIISIFSIVYISVVFLWAFGIVITKRCQANTFQINYMLGIALVVGGGVAYPFTEKTSSVTDLAISLGTLGLTLVFGQWFYIGALTMSKNHGILTMMGFFSIFVGYVISIVRYGETPLFITTLGVCLLFLGMWKTVFNKTNY